MPIVRYLVAPNSDFDGCHWMCYPVLYRSMITYHTIPYHTIPQYTISHYTIPYHITLYYILPYHITLYYTLPYHIIPCHTIPCHTIPYHTMLGVLCLVYHAWWSTFLILRLCEQANFVKLCIRATKHKLNDYDQYLSRSDNCVSIWS